MISHFYPFKRVLAAFVAIAAPYFASARLLVENTAPQSNQYALTVTEEPGGTHIKVDFLSYQTAAAPTQWGQQNVIKFDGGHPMLQKGMPDLYRLTLPIQISNTGNTQVAYIDVQYTDVQNIEVAPSKGNLSRLINPADVPYWKGEVYNQNNFWPAKNAELGEPYVLRDTRGQALHIHPFQYNPVTKTLRAISSITLKVINTGGAGVNEITSTQKHPDDEFTAIYKNHYVNYSNKEKSVSAPEYGDVLIISDPAFMSAMQPYINWKIRKGIKTEMVSVATVGNTTTAIKNYIANYYNTHNLTYVLLVGDLAQIASPTLSGGKSDPSYGYISGNDSYGEVIVGRFSAENVTHVNTQVAKVIKYEKTPPTGNTKFDHTTHIASNEGPGDNNEMDWEHARVIKNKLLTFTYNDHNEYYDATHPAGGNDAAGDPTSANIVNIVNNGTGIINYTGHGSTTSWATTGFSNSSIGSLTNTSIWPFVWSVGCVNGEFDNGTCFGEAWLRATYNSQPAGAIAAFMSSINQSWSPPMAGQDGMVDILMGANTAALQRSFGGVSVNGCIYMNDVYGAAGAEMTDTWHCFGDPSVVVRTADPQNLTATHLPNITLGSTQVVVNCNVDGALVAITQNNTVLGRAYVLAGLATVTIPSLAATDTVFVTATAFNHTPYLGHMLIGVNSNPFVTLESYLVDDALANNNGQADYMENDGINISLNNVGAAASGALTVKLRTQNPFITITDSVYTCGSISAQTISSVSPAFAITVANNVPDQEIAAFDVVITNGVDTWTSSFNLVLNAPALQVTGLVFAELLGNGNNRLDAGETATLTYNNLNNGHANVVNAGTLLYGGDSYVTLTSANIGTIPALNVSTPENALFNIDIATNTPINHYVPFEYTVSSGSYIATYNTMLKVNMLVEDLESGDYSQFAWTNGNQVPWTIDGNIKYEGDYSSRSGEINDNGVTIMQLVVEVLNNDTIAFARKVSSEEGYDYLTFGIDGNVKGQWSGLLDWQRVAYPISAGIHTLTWKYAKDDVYNDNDDAAWVDFIEMPNIKLVTDIATTNATVGTINVFPNPTNGITTIILDTKTNENAIVEVYSAQGQLVRSERIPSNQNQTVLNTQGWAVGLYHIVARVGNNKLTAPLVVR